MSTAQTVLDSIQYRADTSLSLIPVINNAVRVIAKRLYWLESDLLSKDAELTLLTTTDIGTDIVVDGDDQIILDTDIIYSGYAALPTDFWGLKDAPYIDGQKRILEPLPNILVAAQLGSGGIPLYYRVRGPFIIVYPPPSDSSVNTLIMEYFYRPTAIAAVSDTMPFDELFDDAIAEYINWFYKFGTMEGPDKMAMMKEFLHDAVDLIAVKRERRAPKRLPGGIDWSERGDLFR